jgi:integrase
MMASRPGKIPTTSVRRRISLFSGSADAADQPAVHRRVVPQLYPADLPLPRERAKAPYSAAQIAGFLALTDGQPAAGRRMRAAGLVCLGAGAGLIRGDLREVRGTDVTCRSGGVLVSVRGARPRPVPVLTRYHSRLLAAAAFAGTGLICSGADPGRQNITNPLISALDGGGGLPRLDTSGLRATWLAKAAQLSGLATFMAAAGISCSQRLGDLAAGLDPAGEADAVGLLGAARQS